METDRGADYTRRQSYVTVRAPDGKETDRAVETGLSDGYNIEIVSGLEAGETIVYDKSASGSPWAGRGMPGLAGVGRPRR